MDTGNLAIGLAALGVSAWAAWSARHTSRAQTRIQERLLTLEGVRERDRVLLSKSARLRAEIIRLGHDCQLAIRNEGDGEARAVRVVLDDKPLLEHDLVMVRSEELATVLGPGATVRYGMAIVMGSPLRYAVRLEWEDDSGQPGSWRSQLRL